MASIIEGDCRTDFGGATLASGVTTRIIGPLNLGRYAQKCFTVYNPSATTISGVVVRTNPDQAGHETGTSLANPQGIATGPNGGLWETHTVIQSIGSGAVVSVQISDDSHRWFDLVGVNRDSADMTVSGWCYSRTV